MEAFLTIKDTDIERYIQRDPLRQQSIWSNLARKLYPNITSVTDDIKGFIITALGLKVIDKLEKYNNIAFTPKEKNDIKIKYEMIIIYILVEYNIKKNKNIKFLGDNNGMKLYTTAKNNNPIISAEKEILVGQESSGYIGRYNSKTEKLKDKILDITFNNSYDKQKLIDSFFDILKNNNVIHYKDIKDDIKNTIINILQVKDNQKEKYLNTLGIISKEEKYLNNIYEILKNDNSLNIKEIFSNNNSNETIKNILALEPFLTYLNNIFYTLLKQDNLNNLENNNELNKMVDELKDYYNKNKLDFFFKEDYYPNLRDNIRKSNTEIIHALIDDHIKIITEDKSNPWIKKINNKYYIIHTAKRDIIEPESEFSHLYYLDAVQSLIRSMDSWK